MSINNLIILKYNITCRTYLSLSTVLFHPHRLSDFHFQAFQRWSQKDPVRNSDLAASTGFGSSTPARDANIGFTCHIDSVKDIVDVLNCLAGGSRKDIHCFIEATPESLTLSVTGRSKAVQARLTLEAELFDEYRCRSTINSNNNSRQPEEEATGNSDEHVKLALNLCGLLDCLQLFGSSDTTAATMTYDTSDELFRLSLEEGGILTTCELNAMHLDSESEEDHGVLFQSFQGSPEQCAALMHTVPLREAMQELFETSLGAEYCRAELSQSGISFFSVGNTETCCEIHFEAPSQGGSTKSDIFLSYQYERNQFALVAWEYSISSLHLSMKALGVAKETFVRVNMEGVMCVQHQVQGHLGKDIILDYALLPTMG